MMRAAEATRTAKSSSRATTTHHARAGEHVPTQTDAIAVLDLAPLLLQSFVVHLDEGRWEVFSGSLARVFGREVRLVYRLTGHKVSASSA